MGIKLFAKFVEMPKAVLIPLILVLCVVGSYSINSSITDVYWMLAFGVIGYLLKIFGFQMGPIILGAILGPLMDNSYRQAMSSAGNDLGQLFGGLFTSPLSLILLTGVVLILLGNSPLGKKFKKSFKTDAKAN